jgi:hypothetical protein
MEWVRTWMAKCRVCREVYTKRTSTQAGCSIACATKIAIRSAEKRKKADAKLDRKQTRERLAKLKPISHWMNLTQKVANEYARVRDYRDGCISCELPATWDGGAWHGSHFRSVGAASAVRLNLWNIHKACASCNAYKGGNIAAYEPRLRKKLGNEKVEWLKSQNKITKYTREYLERYRRVIGKRLRRMESK